MWKSLQPHQRVVDDVPPDGPGVHSVEVDPVTPVVAALGEVRAESRQVVATRSEMVVDDIQDHGEPVAVGGVDEALQPVGAAVGLVGRVPADTVVAPSAAAAEGVDGHQLDVADSQLDEVCKMRDRRVERPGRGERADVQLVDDRSRQRPAGPRLVRPLVVVGVPAAGLMDAVGLPARSGVGQDRVVAIEQESVVGAVRDLDVDAPPAVVLGPHLVRLAAHPGPDPLGQRRPDPQLGHCRGLESIRRRLAEARRGFGSIAHARFGSSTAGVLAHLDCHASPVDPPHTSGGRRSTTRRAAGPNPCGGCLTRGPRAQHCPAFPRPWPRCWSEPRRWCSPTDRWPRSV